MKSLTTRCALASALLLIIGCSGGEPRQGTAQTPQPPASHTTTAPAATTTPATTSASQTASPTVLAANSPDNTENKESVPMQHELATFGAGCFWGVEATFRLLPGVIDAAVGYEGGKTKDPTYKEVCYEDTGHAEVVQVKFDPSKVSYEKIVDVFFKMHDPTQVNRQGPDIGDQYRSVIFYHSPEQQKIAEAVKARFTASGRFKRPIATVIEPAQTFYRAEEYHQQYFAKHGLENTCHLPPAD